MDNQNTAPKIMKETKNKIVVDFERAPLKERLKAKYGTSNFARKILVSFFRFILLLGLSYVILFPFFSKISTSFMSPMDFLQSDVKLIPKYPTLDQYKYLVTENGYFRALLNTFLLSTATAVIQMLVCAFVGYGFAKFKFKGNKLVFGLVLLSMIVPDQILVSSLVQKFMYPSILGISLTPLTQAMGLTQGFYNTYVPIFFLSLTGLAFKNGLFIFIMRQFYRGIPDELEESSYVDGYGPIKTFFLIILPLSVPMLVTVFLLAFSWQWTDIFYTNTFLNSADHALLTGSKFWQIMPSSLKELADETGGDMSPYIIAVKNTSALMIVAPLLIMYLFMQRYLIQGIAQSGFGGM